MTSNVNINCSICTSNEHVEQKCPYNQSDDESSPYDKSLEASVKQSETTIDESVEATETKVDESTETKVDESTETTKAKVINNQGSGSIDSKDINNILKYEIDSSNDSDWSSEWESDIE